MKLEINISNKVLLLLSVILIVSVLSFTAIAVQTNFALIPYHYVNEIYPDASSTDSIDALNSNGIVDWADHAVYGEQFDSKVLGTLPDSGSMNFKCKATFDNPEGDKYDDTDNCPAGSNNPPGCVYLNNHNYGGGQWIACPTGYYIAGVTDDDNYAQDIFCCPLPGIQ